MNNTLAYLLMPLPFLPNISFDSKSYSWVDNTHVYIYMHQTFMQQQSNALHKILTFIVVDLI